MSWGVPAAITPSVVAGGGAIAMLWGNLKLYFSKIVGLLIITVDYDDQLAMAMGTLLNKEFKCSRIGKKKYGGWNEYVRPIERNQLVVYERIPHEPTIWWKGWRPLLVSNDGQSLTLTFIRGIYNVNSLAIETVDKFNAMHSTQDWRKGDRFFVRKLFGHIGLGTQETRGSNKEASAEVTDSSRDKLMNRPLRWTRDELGQPNRKSAMSDLSLEDHVTDAVKSATLWRDSEKWFKKRHIPWKRGMMLYGKPGTGKTAFIRALGQELNMPIYSFALATMTNKDFSDCWEEAMDRTPCIFLFEDIDAVFKGRENVAVKGMENGLTFDGFLNSLDGVENTDGVFIVITTNNIETIDSALGKPTNGGSDGSMSSRPGRIDRTVEFRPLDEKGRIKMAKRIFEGFKDDQWKDLLKETKDTGAQFQERCCRLALRLFWETEQTKTLN